MVYEMNTIDKSAFWLGVARLSSGLNDGEEPFFAWWTIAQGTSSMRLLMYQRPLLEHYEVAAPKRAEAVSPHIIWPACGGRKSTSVQPTSSIHTLFLRGADNNGRSYVLGDGWSCT